MDEDYRSTIKWVVVGFILAALIPTMLSIALNPSEAKNIYYEFLPFERFMSDVNITASSVDLNEFCCSDVNQVIYMSRTANIDLRGEVIYQLTLVNADYESILYTVMEPVFYREGEITRQFIIYLPSDISPGYYYWVFEIELHVSDAVSKKKVFISNIFEVYNTGDLNGI